MTDKLQDLFDQATAEELAPLLDGSVTAEAPDEMTAARIARSVEEKIKREKTPRRPWLRAAVAAAAAVITLGGGAYGVVAEAREYRAAVSFFEENDLSTDGLSRGEIKAVYRDITSRSFAYEETGRVIGQSVNTVSGYEISARDFTPQQLAQLWQRQNATVGVTYSTPIHMMGYIRNTNTALSGAPYLEKTEDGELVWRAEFPTIDIWNFTTVADGVVVYGFEWDWRAILAGETADSPVKPMIGKADFAGNVLWSRAADNGFAREEIQTGVENPDGGFTLFSIGYDMTLDDWHSLFSPEEIPENPKTLCVARYSADGKLLRLDRASLAGYSFVTIWKATRLSDGYLLKCTLSEGGTAEPPPVLLKVTDAGEIQRILSYESEDTLYYFRDMIDYGGQIFLSGYSVPKSETRNSEIGTIYDTVFDMGEELMQIYMDDHVKNADQYARVDREAKAIWTDADLRTDGDLRPYKEIYEETFQQVFGVSYQEHWLSLATDYEDYCARLTELLQGNYTALLMRCDADAGTPRAFYTVPGGIGGSLAREADGSLIWAVEQITDSRFDVGPLPEGTANVQAVGFRHNYRFDPQGALVSREITDEVLTH